AAARGPPALHREPVVARLGELPRGLLDRRGVDPRLPRRRDQLLVVERVAAGVGPLGGAPEDLLDLLARVALMGHPSRSLPQGVPPGRSPRPWPALPRSRVRDQHIPPLTPMTCPVMYPAASLHRNATTAATSSTLP